MIVLNPLWKFSSNRISSLAIVYINRVPMDIFMSAADTLRNPLCFRLFSLHRKGILGTHRRMFVFVLLVSSEGA